jgi:hypothetical protein
LTPLPAHPFVFILRDFISQPLWKSGKLTGERTGVIRKDFSSGSTIRWWGPDHVLALPFQHQLFNLRTNSFEATLAFPKMDPAIMAYEWSPDGRPWWYYGDRLLFTVLLPQVQDADAVFKSGSAVALEAA